LISSALQRQSITELARLFNARVVDVSLESVIIELSAKPDRVDAFVELLKPFGILEAARSGTMAMPRAVMEGLSSKETIDQADAVDLSSLPPG
jgi:acetolactate synthase-1/3 small subunit